MTNEKHRADMEMIKEMGANFVRLAHYPHDPEIYNVCDEFGLLLWASCLGVEEVLEMMLGNQIQKIYLLK